MSNVTLVLGGFVLQGPESCISDYLNNPLFNATGVLTVAAAIELIEKGTPAGVTARGLPSASGWGGADADEAYWARAKVLLVQELDDRGLLDEAY
jgi:hypothetical protein